MSSTPIFEDLCREHAEAGKAYPSANPPERADKGTLFADAASAKASADDRPVWVSPEQRVA